MSYTSKWTLSLLLSFLLSSCVLETNHSTDETPDSKQKQAEDQIVDYMKRALDDHAYGVYGEGVLENADSDFAEVGSSVETTSSSTNLQEQGVDELDTIKVNNPHQVMYSIHSDGIQVTGFDDEGKLTGIVQQVASGSHLKGLYFGSGKLTAVNAGALSIYENWFYPSYFANQETGLSIHPINDDGSLSTEAETLTFQGGLLSSRRVDDTLYLVLRHYPDVSYTKDNEINKEALTIDAILPNYSRNDVEQGNSVEALNCVLNEETANLQANLINLVSIDLSSEDLAFTSQCYIGDAEALYASTNALYLASSGYDYHLEEDVPVYDTAMTTDIHKFAFVDEGVEYQGSGGVRGHLGWQQARKSFRMSEYNGDLRVVTFDEARPWLEFALDDVAIAADESEQSSPVRLTVLRSNEDNTALETISTLPNESKPDPIGKPNEQLYASQFMGDKAYLVTFRVIDPLYVLNLADPTDPFIEGELEIEGYSDYLFPVGNDLLIGVGKDAVADEQSTDWGGAWYQGVKVSLIDVSDPVNPTEIDKVVVGKRGTESAALYDHHAYNQFNLDGSTRLTLPIQVHEKPSQWATGSDSDWYEYSYTGLFKFEIDLNQKDLIHTGTMTVDESSDGYSYYNYSQQRSRMIEEQVHFLFDETFYSQDWLGAEAVSVLSP